MTNHVLESVGSVDGDLAVGDGRWPQENSQGEWRGVIKEASWWDATGHKRELALGFHVNERGCLQQVHDAGIYAPYKAVHSEETGEQG